MADVIEERINLQSEEVAYRAAVSEATFSRVAAALNFVNKRQYDCKTFYLNGPYGLAPTPQTAVDGAHGMLFDVEIVGCMMFNIVPGVSGTTTLNVKRHTASGMTGASIFSTKPSISSAAPANSFVFSRFGDNPTILENPSGTVAPVLSVTQLDAGDLLTLDMDTNQAGAENCGLVLYFRPR
jgi:hypothetical protein